MLTPVVINRIPVPIHCDFKVAVFGVTAEKGDFIYHGQCPECRKVISFKVVDAPAPPKRNETPF